MCHKFVVIVENNYINKTQLEKFDSMHYGHPVQIVNEEELENYEEWEDFS